MAEGRTRRSVVVRMVRLQDSDQDDAEFWARMTGEERVALLWDMVNEARAIKGLEGDEPRLQRSVEHIRRG